MATRLTRGQREELARRLARRAQRIRANRAHPCAVRPDVCFADPLSADAAAVCFDGKGPRPTGAYHTYRPDTGRYGPAQRIARKRSRLALLRAEDLVEELFEDDED